MMRIYIIFLFAILSNAAWAQHLNPVHWSYEAKKISDTEYDLVLTAHVDKGWFIYSQYLESDEGPIPTSFVFNENEKYEVVGEAAEAGHKKEGFDPIFGMNLIKFDGKVQFIQHIQLKGKINEVTGSLEFMTCDDERCLPPTTVEFVVKW